MVEMAAEKVPHLSESAGFSAADITPLQKQPHMDYAKNMLELEPTFNILASNHIEKGCLKAVATVTRIPDGTLKDWRRHLLTDREWRPSEHRNGHHRSLTEEQEAEVVQGIHGQYLSEFHWRKDALVVDGQRDYGTMRDPVPVTLPTRH
jgi:hypothetical protein